MCVYGCVWGGCGCVVVLVGFPGGSDNKKSACSVGDLGLIPGFGRSSGGEHGNPLARRILMDRGAWGATVHGGCKELDTTERLRQVLWEVLLNLLLHYLQPPESLGCCDLLEGVAMQESKAPASRNIHPAGHSRVSDRFSGSLQGWLSC